MLHRCSEVFQTVLVVNIQAFPISRTYQICACGINKFCVSRVYYAYACSNTQAFPLRKCSKQVLVVDTQASVSTRLCCACKNTLDFPSQECFGLALVVKHKLVYLVIVVLVGTCGEHTSFLSKGFQACA